MGIKWANERWNGLQPVGYRPWEDPPGHPIAGKVERWPHPLSPRVNGHFISMAEPDLNFLCEQIWGRVQYSNNPDSLPTGGPVWNENFVGHWEALGPSHLLLEGPESNYGSSLRMEAQFTTSDPLSGNPGLVVEQEIGTNGSPPVSRTLVFPRYFYNQGNHTVGMLQDPDRNKPVFGPPWTTRDAYWQGLAQCYPQSTLDIHPPEPLELEVNELIGIHSKMVPSQSINGGVFLDLQAPDREFGGLWWDPAGNANEIIVPSPYNWVSLGAQMRTGTALVNQISFYFAINGAFNAPYRIGSSRRLSGLAQNLDIPVGMSPWIPVSPGDIIQIWASQSGGSLSSNAAQNWVAVRGAYMTLA